MSGDDLIAVHVARHFDAAPERVFDAFLDSGKVRRFLFAEPGARIVACDIDPRVGGALRIVKRRGDTDIEHVGTYLEIDRPRRLVFEFAVPQYDRTMTRVTIDLAADGAGCALSLTHEVLPGWEKDVTKGWAMILDALGAVVA